MLLGFERRVGTTLRRALDVDVKASIGLHMDFPPDSEDFGAQVFCMTIANAISETPVPQGAPKNGLRCRVPETTRLVRTVKPQRTDISVIALRSGVDITHFERSWQIDGITKN